MKTSERWIEAIESACKEPDFSLSNQRITRLHYLLSEALVQHLGRDAGPNFHTWAVWGSRKAGVTIRQEDLDNAVQNATVTAGTVGGIVGAGAGLLFGRLLRWKSTKINAALGVTAGIPTGAMAGRRIAVWSRRKAATLILRGNQAVLQDIGKQSLRFLELLESGAPLEGREKFFEGIRKGPTENLGQDRLSKAFRLYLAALDSDNLEQKREAMILANCEIVYHEHIRLEPFIRGAMPFIVQRCATQRLMTFEIGNKVLSVGEGVPGHARSTAAKNWARIEDRMRYIFALFREFHGEAEIFSAPYPE